MYIYFYIHVYNSNIQFDNGLKNQVLVEIQGGFLSVSCEYAIYHTEKWEHCNIFTIALHILLSIYLYLFSVMRNQ
jgi:hypothetical protein